MNHRRVFKEIMPLYYNLTIAVCRFLTYIERYTFTGKERDAETGYSDHGARYLDHALLTSWLSPDPLADKYPSISPYAYCAWNPVKLVDESGLYPKSIVHYDRNAFYRVGGYRLTKPATHFLSLVSGVNESLIKGTVIVKRGPGHYLPWYNSKNGGGAITLGDKSLNSNIILTQNFFEDNPSKYNGHGFGQNISEWLEILSHEVGHIPQIDKNGGMWGYTGNLLSEYIHAGKHDGAPSEIEADKGRVTYSQFSRFISSKYGENALSDLFKSDNTDNFKIRTIDKWWNEFIQTNEN